MVNPVNKALQDKLEHQGNKVLQEKEVLLNHQEEMVLMANLDNRNSKVKVDLWDNKEYQVSKVSKVNVENQELQVMQDHLGNKVHLGHLVEMNLLDNLVNQVHKDKLVLQGGKEHLAPPVHQMSVVRWEHLALLLGMETMDSQVSVVNPVRETKLEHRVN